MLEDWGPPVEAGPQQSEQFQKRELHKALKLEESSKSPK